MIQENQKKFLDFSKPFVEATKNVFATMVHTKIEPQKLQLKSNTYVEGEITAFIGINGSVTRDGTEKEFKAIILLSFPESTYIKVASAMLMETFTTLNENNRDVGGEIVNIITGNTKRALNEMGYKPGMSIPTIVTGKNYIMSYPSNSTIVTITINSVHGPFFMDICYAE